ncbi:hypothetical protein LptCag_1661 [Leptospirillum ferriphilum]|jgi:hypothetical protein|uniref:Uncharacterized protein n=2 Tax=Leptospirillum ferriphilum TaxID=178606 RepID=A0A094WAY6_9BACT|nr:hypothetical protein LFML04_1648 [Leptospirillum ferriphilum ML-04]KGA92827.1 hypothetical protein LptCag_1661 [Leptospirillum ferriphilum]
MAGPQQEDKKEKDQKKKFHGEEPPVFQIEKKRLSSVDVRSRRPGANDEKNKWIANILPLPSL